jgi:hypothetical protein
MRHRQSTQIANAMLWTGVTVWKVIIAAVLSVVILVCLLIMLALLGA